MPDHPKPAFSLIELLVVVTIIIALVAILIPSMGKAIERAMDAKCAANLHQSSMAIFSYASDHYGNLAIRDNGMQGPALYDTGGGPAVPGGDWLRQRFVPGYLPDLGVWACTFSEVPDIEDERNTRAWCYGSFAYWASNGTATPGFGSYDEYPLHVAAAPSTMALIQDVVSDNRAWRYAPGWRANHTTGDYWIWTAMNNVNPSNVNRRTDEEHDVRGGNVATFSGSVGWYTMGELDIAYVDNHNRPYYSRWAGY